MLKAADFLCDVAEAVGAKVFQYFGDLDPRGLRIGCELSEIMNARNLVVTPAEDLYSQLLLAPRPRERKPVIADEQSLAWLSLELRESVRKHLANFGRIAQEALGWEKLCSLHGAVANADFSLGFIR